MSMAGAVEAWPLLVLVWREEWGKNYSQKERKKSIFRMPVAKVKSPLTNHRSGRWSQKRRMRGLHPEKQGINSSDRKSLVMFKVKGYAKKPTVYQF